MSTVIRLIASTPSSAMIPALNGLRSVRDRHQLDWDLARITANEAVHLDQAHWLIAGIPAEFKNITCDTPARQRITLIPRSSNPIGEYCYCRLEDESFGALAARHAAEQGYRRCVTIETPRAYHKRRQHGFAEACSDLGIDHIHYRYSDHPLREMREHQLFTWLATLPRPTLIYRPVDHQALWLRDALLDRGYGIPGDFALIGSGDHLLCSFSDPQLTSVAHPWWLMGEAAGMAILHREQGNPNPPIPILRPSQVIARASSQRIKIDDPIVKKALRWLSAHLDCSTPVSSAAAHVRVSPATLGRHFQNTIHTSIKQEHNRMRITRAEDLLQQPGLSLATIAVRSGFSCTTALGVAFKRRHKVSLSDWRKGLPQAFS